MADPAKLIVIDASIALAWILPDEKTSPSANRLYNRSTTGEITLIAPELLLYEVLNGIRSAVIQRRLPRKLINLAINHFIDLAVLLQKQEEYSQDIVKIALNKDLSVYDAAYVALAKKLKVIFCTADQKLAKKISKFVKIELLGK